MTTAKIGKAMPVVRQAALSSSTASTPPRTNSSGPRRNEEGFCEPLLLNEEIEADSQGDQSGRSVYKPKSGSVHPTLDSAQEAEVDDRQSKADMNRPLGQGRQLAEACGIYLKADKSQTERPQKRPDKTLHATEWVRRCVFFTHIRTPFRRPTGGPEAIHHTPGPGRESSARLPHLGRNEVIWNVDATRAIEFHRTGMQRD